MPKSPKKPQNGQTIPAAVATQIDENLRRIYAARLTEEIPARLQDLLRQLREKDASP